MQLSMNVDMISILWALLLTVCPSSDYAGQICAMTIPRWMQPCRGSIDSNPELLEYEIQSNPESDQLVAHRLWIKADDVKAIATVLRDQLAEERIQSSDLQVYLDENTTLPGFPDHRALNARTLFIERLHEDYRRISIASIFVEQMLLDEEDSTYSPSYSVHFRHMESKIYPLLCQMKMAILHRDMMLPYVSNDVMDTSQRIVETRAQRHMRDYRILKDIVRLFHSIQLDYQNIRNGN